DIDVVAEFVDEDKDDKSHAELESVQSPIYGEKCEKAEKEFQFEEREKKHFALRQQNGDGSERAEPLSPFAFRRSLGSVFFGEFEFVDFSANPFGLIRIVWEQRKGFPPFVASLWQGVLLFEFVCFRGNAD